MPNVIPMSSWYRATAPNLVIAFAILIGCNPAPKKDACGEALLQGRSLASQGDIERARQQLAIAADICKPRRSAYVDDLRGHIDRKEAAKREAATHARAKEAEAEQEPLHEYVVWIHTHIDAPEKSVADVHCFERAHPEHGWCEATLDGKSGAKMRVRYWKNDPAAHRFSTRVDAPARCEDIGEHRVVRRWTKQHSDAAPLERAHCEFLSQRLRGRKGLVARGPGWTEVHVFSTAFLGRDAAFSNMVEREGR